MSTQISYLLDVSWLLYKGHFALSHRTFGETVYLLSKIKTLQKTGIVYLCIDGKPKGVKINPEYKQDRPKVANVYINLPTILYCLKDLKTIKIKYNGELEADEVIFSLSTILEGRREIVSGDNDLLQALTNGVVINRGRELISEAYYNVVMEDKFFAIPPERLPIYRSIVGDTSDNLKGVFRFPHKLAAVIAKEVAYDGVFPPAKQSLEALKDAAEGTSKAWYERLIEGYDMFASNFNIMKLCTYTDIDQEPPMALTSDFPNDCKQLIKAIREYDRKQAI